MLLMLFEGSQLKANMALLAFAPLFAYTQAMSIRRPLPEPATTPSAPPPAYSDATSSRTVNAGAFRANNPGSAARPQSAVVPPSSAPSSDMYADTRPLNYRPQTMHASGPSGSTSFPPPPGSPPQQQQQSYKQPNGPPSQQQQQQQYQQQHGRTPSMQSQQGAPLARSNTREDPLSVCTSCPKYAQRSR